MTQVKRDQASDSEEVVTPLMLDGTYLSRNSPSQALQELSYVWEREEKKDNEEVNQIMKKKIAKERKVIPDPICEIL